MERDELKAGVLTAAAREEAAATSAVAAKEEAQTLRVQREELRAVADNSRQGGEALSAAFELFFSPMGKPLGPETGECSFPSWCPDGLVCFAPSPIGGGQLCSRLKEMLMK